MSSRNKTGLMNIKPDKISYKILQWMQEYEGTNALKNTTGHIIAEKIAALPEIENGELTIEQTFSKMVKSNIVYRDRYDKSIYSDFRINYWHKSIPQEILANAPAEVKRAMAKTIDSMQENQYMDDEGCVVTPNSVEKSEDPFGEDEPEEGQEEDGTKTYTNTDIDEEGDGQVSVAHIPTEEPEIVEEPQQISVPVEVKKDGKSMSITVNLTINL